MKKILPFCLIGLILFGGAFFSCSNKKEPEAEKGAIEKMTEDTAREVVKGIRAPIDKARSVAQQEADRVKDMEDKAKNQ